VKSFGIVLTAAVVGLTGCAPNGTPLERGQWQVSTTFNTPKVDGASIDELRKNLPADSKTTECMMPYVRTGSDVIKYFNLRRNKCDITGASSENGVIHGEGDCSGVAQMMGGPDKKDAWVKFAGTYGQRSIDVTADFVITMKSDKGETHRATFTASHKAERIGECS
jgi:hypothetical protein